MALYSVWDSLGPRSIEVQHLMHFVFAISLVATKAHVGASLQSFNPKMNVFKPSLLQLIDFTSGFFEEWQSAALSPLRTVAVRRLRTFEAKGSRTCAMQILPCI